MSFVAGDLIVHRVYAGKMNSRRAPLGVMKVVKPDILVKVEDFQTFLKGEVLHESVELHNMFVGDTSIEDMVKHLNQNYIGVVDARDPSMKPSYVDKREFIKFTGDASGLGGGSLKRSRTKKNKTVRRSRIKNSLRSPRPFLRRS
jgi:hypothetical protein